jgi:hypothetical protein
VSTYLDYCVGLDLGQAQDYTALAVLEEPIWLTEAWASSLLVDGQGWVSPAAVPPGLVSHARAFAYQYGRPAKPPLSLRHLERFPLRTPYPAIVERVAALLQTPPLAQRAAVLLVDATGVGAAVVDLFRQAGLAPIAVTITGGDVVSSAEHGYRTPKRDLVAAVQALLQTERLKIAAALPEAPTLVAELLAFQMKLTTVVHDTYGLWREGQHDDLVLAVALACWYREWWHYHLDHANSTQRGA